MATPAAVALALSAMAACHSADPGAASGFRLFAPREPVRALRTSVQPVRRLTHTEYDHTVRDLLGDTSAPARAFPSEATGHTGFASPAAVSDVEARRFVEAAEALAATAARDPGHLADCDPARTKGGDRACAKRFVAAFGRRAYRRPLKDAEIAEHLAVYDATRAAGETHADAVRVLLTAMLQSPHFLYHSDEGTPVTTASGPAVKLSAHALASRLSYALWSSMPDAALFAAADDDRLSTPAEVEAQARRMLTDGRARDMVADLVGQLLRLDRLRGMVKDKKAFKEWSPDLARAMADETALFASEVILGGPDLPDRRQAGHVRTLLSAPFSFVGGPLARLYGLNGDDNPKPRAVAFDPQRRAGLLTQGSFLSINANAYESSPILRGKFVRETLLCQTVAPPPPGVPPLPSKTDATSLRERLEDHVLSGTCGRCHRALDPVGFGLEAYDAIGRYAPAPDGVTLDVSGEVKSIDGADRPFTGPRQLAALLSESAEVSHCLSRQVYRYINGQRESAEDEASLAAAYDRFAASDFDVRELIVALVRSSSFRYRKLETGELPQ